jgi:hypothetical protein
MSIDHQKNNEPCFSIVDIRNPKILDILNTSVELGLFDDTSKSKIKYESVDYEKESTTYCSIDFFRNVVEPNKQNHGRANKDFWIDANGNERSGAPPIKHKKNGFADKTPGGKYFIKCFEDITGLDLGDGSQPFAGFRSSTYNPNGYLGWHKDNYYGVYTIMFSYCVDNPNGFYRWVDNHTGEITTLPDKPGWSCKSMLNIDDEHAEWHTIYTATPRCSLVVTFGDFADYVKLRDFIQSDK